MGWYKQACPTCWDHHDGACEDYQRQRAHWQSANETQRLLREQNDLLRIAMAYTGKGKGTGKGGGKRGC